MKMTQTPRVRFAPSPTGYLHVGGARTALFNYLFARHHGGVFILRIEDTDRSRFKDTALKEIFDGLEWLGLLWDEGPDKPGAGGPYIQSHRLDIYREKAEQLLEKGAAYRCFCTPERLHQMRTEHPGTGYDGRCRTLSRRRSDQQAEGGIAYVIRQKIPEDRLIGFTDAIRGSIEYRSDILDDAVLLKSDGFPTYHLASVVDDHLMRITHVMRGDEWIASTPRHILLYDSLGWPIPVFAHMPVILSPDGGKLSKRKGAASVLDYREAGFLPGALRNFLALLGWSPGDDREIMTLEEMIERFSLENITPKAAVFDEKKLEWMNGHYLRMIRSEELLDDIRKGWIASGLISPEDGYSREYLLRVVGLMKDRARRLGDIIEQPVYFFKDPTSYMEKAAKKRFTPEAVPRLKTLMERLERLVDFNARSIESEYRDLAASQEIGAGKLIHPTRLALSGVDFGPGLFEMMELIGKETVLRRLERATDWIEKKTGKFQGGEDGDG